MSAATRADKLLTCPRARPYRSMPLGFTQAFCRLFSFTPFISCPSAFPSSPPKSFLVRGVAVEIQNVKCDIFMQSFRMDGN